MILRGPSGGGKTTLLNIMGAIDSATSGEVEILGEVISENSKDAFLSNLRLRKIGIFVTVSTYHAMSCLIYWYWFMFVWRRIRFPNFQLARNSISGIISLKSSYNI